MYYVCKYYKGKDVIYTNGTVFNPYSKYLDLARDYEELSNFDRVEILECECKADMTIYARWLESKYKPKLNVTVGVGDTNLVLSEEGFVNYTKEEFRIRYFHRSNMKNF